MMKKLLKSTNFLFVIAMFSVMLIHIYFLFAIPGYDDESHYLSIPFRIINGDSLVQHEWHLTQFASLFTYLPVRIWLAIKGSADGIFIFTRCVYLVIHTSVAVTIYRCFREYGKWAILASIMFFVQVPYGIQAISYHTMFVAFLLLFTLCLLSIYKSQSKKSYILAGMCFACCCVSNPLFCIVFVLYLVGCALWTKRDAIKNYIFNLKTKNTSNKGKKLTKKQKKEQKKQVLEAFPEIENYNCFFTKEAITKITCGILIVAIIAVVYFFFAGGTIGSIFDNIENLFNSSSEYDIKSGSIFSKLFETLGYFTKVSLFMPWILPLLLIVMSIDKKRKTDSHRRAYLIVSILLMIVIILGIVLNTEVYTLAISLPFCVFSVVCYMLTEKKNKVLFNCMFVPCLIASVFHYLAADTHWAAIGIVLAISNVAGVFFARDLWREMRITSTSDDEVTCKKKTPVMRGVIIVAFCMQIIFYSVFYQCGYFYEKDSLKVTTGPYAGLYMTQEKYDSYNKTINDLNVIKSISDEDDPVLVASFRIWTYLYLDRPIAIYTTWYRGGFDMKVMADYYKENPSRIPKYIYIESPNLDESAIRYKINILSEMFEVTRQDLSNGVLLTVEDCKI